MQGVGYRDWTRRTAKRLALSGTVRNRADGTVAATFSGPPEAVVAMIAACRKGPPSARVTDVAFADRAEEPAPGFRILRD